MEYKQLSEELIPEYLASVEAMRSIFSSLEDLEIHEIGDGNLNYVYAVSNRRNPAETVILKQAVPFLRCVGESSPLSKERMNFEIMALKKELELCPGLVPEIYHADRDMALVIMQNLNRHKILRGEMNEGKIFPRLAEDMSTFLANTLFYSSDWYLPSAEKKDRVEKFINKDLCELTENFIFTHPFFQSETNDYNPELTAEDIAFIQQDPELKAAACSIKYKFMNNAETMLHGDLHTGSIMLNEEETFVIDPEFAFYGPAGFDLGLLCGNLALAYLAHSYRQPVLLGNDPAPYRRWILETIKGIWEGFAAKYDALWAEHQAETQQAYWDFPGGDESRAALRRHEIRRIFRDAMAIAGCVMIRRTLGLAKVSDIAGIEDLAARADIDRMALKAGRELLVRAEGLGTIDEALAILQQASPLE